MRGIAWSVPIVAVSVATPLAAASTADADLAPLLIEQRAFLTGTLLVPDVTFEAPTQLAVANVGTSPSHEGTTSTLQDSGWLLTLAPEGIGITAQGDDGDLMITLPSIDRRGRLADHLIEHSAGREFAIALEELDELYRGVREESMTAAIARHDTNANNATATAIGYELPG